MDTWLTLERLNELLQNSVKEQLISDVPLGVFLSGGIDSSALVAYAHKLGNRNINTYTINYVNKESEDNIYAKLVSNKFSTNHTEVKCGNKYTTQY